jgi:hypothetical protein
MPADCVEGIADGDEALPRVVKSALLELSYKCGLKYGSTLHRGVWKRKRSFESCAINWL